VNVFSSKYALEWMCCSVNVPLGLKLFFKQMCSLMNVSLMNVFLVDCVCETISQLENRALHENKYNKVSIALSASVVK
jgi:hypothetical protein